MPGFISSWELLRATLFPGRNLGGISIDGVCRGREVCSEVLGLLSGKPLLARVLAVVSEFPSEELVEQEQPSPTSETVHLHVNRAVPLGRLQWGSWGGTLLWVPRLPLVEE